MCGYKLDIYTINGARIWCTYMKALGIEDPGFCL
jgi:hypothetical protein